MAFLCLQFGLFAIGSEIFIMAGNKWERGNVVNHSLCCLLWIATFTALMRIRSGIANLSDTDLSGFLSNSVVKVGVFVGLGQLAFLAFASIQCLSEATVEGKLFSVCKRTL